MAKSVAAKSRTEKKGASGTPATHEIVPGKFNEHDW